MELDVYRKILIFTYDCEVEAEAIYNGIADKLKNKNLKELFLTLAMEENSHHRILRNFYNNPDNAQKFDGSKNYGVTETVESPTLSDDMKPADAFAIAIKTTEKAMMQYIILADGCSDPEQKTVFNNLAAMESEHKQKIKQVLENMAYPEAW